MAIVKKSELKQMDAKQLKGKLVELKKEMMKLNGQRATGTTLENPGRVGAVRKTIAKIHTLLHQHAHHVQITTEKTKEVKTEKRKV